MTTIIPGVPQFGNLEHIRAVRTAELLAEFKAIPKCRKCEGEGICGHCDTECVDCDGLGKHWFDLERFREKHPGVSLVDLRRLETK